MAGGRAVCEIGDHGWNALKGNQRISTWWLYITNQMNEFNLPSGHCHILAFDEAEGVMSVESGMYMNEMLTWPLTTR